MTQDLVVSHYRVLNAIGEGGMGEVYLGIDETLRRRVALKSIRREHRLDASTKVRFLREARTLSQLDHPHICRVYDYIETPDRDWIVLELVEGETLAGAIHGGALSTADRLRIGQQIAAVLVATHAAGVIHRDLKPGNVMLSPTGDVKVLDFGLAASTADLPPGSGDTRFALDLGADSREETRLPGEGAAEASQFRSVAGAIKGTVAYMSPEQARGELATSASDMYSYGLVVQELFSGQRPYADTGDYLQLLDKAARGETLRPTGMPASLTALVTRLKSLAPAQRPTAVDTLDRLHWIADRPRRVRRNLVVAAVLLAMISGAIKYTVDLSRERNAALAARDEARQRRGQAEGLIGFMVGDLRAKLTSVGRLELLDDIGKQALAYFASVPADTLSDEELYRRSQALHQLGQVRQARADVPGALKAFQDSLAEAEAVVLRNPGNSEWQLGLGASHFYIGDLMRTTNNLPAALAHFQAYQKIAEGLVARDPNNFTWKLEQSYGHSNVAAIYSRQGDLDKAREQLEIVTLLQADLATRNPADRTLQTSRANSFNRLGIVRDALGELEGAVTSFEREQEVYRVLLAADARDARVRRRAAISHIYCGLVLRALGREPEAAAQLAAAVREALALVALDSTNADWQRDLASARMALGRLELGEGRVAKAHDRFKDGVAMFVALSEKNRARNGALDLASAQTTLAEALRVQRQFTAADRQIDVALAVLQSLAAKTPADVDVSRDLAIAENERGLISAATGRLDQARAAWTRALALLEPHIPRSRDRRLLDPWVRSLLHLGRIEDARRGYQRLAAIGYRDRAFLGVWQQQSSSNTAEGR